jgi:PAS domain S-box-containing protein
MAADLADYAPGFLDAFDDAVIATDIGGTIIYWNAAAERLYGWKAEEVAGRNILDVTPSARSRPAAAAIMTVLSRGETWRGEFETTTRSGETLTVAVTDYPVRDRQGRLAAIVGVSRRVLPPPARAAANERPVAAVKTARPGASGWLAADFPRLVQGLVIAALLFVAAITSRLLLDQVLPNRLPFITFFPAVAVSALLAGLWPTVVLLLALAVTGSLWVSPLEADIVLFRAVSGGAFLLSGAVLVGILLRLMRIRQELVREQGARELVNQELRHRLKNVFAIVSSVAQQTIRSGLPREALADAIAGRIRAIATAQDILKIAATGATDIEGLVQAIVAPLSPSPARLIAAGTRVPLPAELATPFALVLHELATNAVKHGAWSTATGAVSVAWHMQNGRLVLLWHEPPTGLSAPVQQGFGSTLIRRALDQADVRHEVGPNGVDCRIELRL